MDDTQGTRDPVCGMTVDPTTATASEQYHGKTYYFCSDDCHRTFVADPTSFVTA